MGNTVNIFAYYQIRNSNASHMDATADSVMTQYPATHIGRGIDLITGERDIQWRLYSTYADQAKKDLEAAGFRVSVSSHVSPEAFDRSGIEQPSDQVAEDEQ